jgi:CubicO group peptidase (beta-lactamase class C family)
MVSLRVFLLLMVLLLISCPALASAEEGAGISAEPPSEIIDRLMSLAMNDGLVAGGVVLVGDSSGILFEKAYGQVAPGVDAPLTALDTVFDLASLTKVIATAPAIMALAEEGSLRLVDPVSRWFPEFASRGRDDLLVMHLLTHTSGLDDFPLPAEAPLAGAIEKAASQRPQGEVGVRFRYADINFILLGELVRRVSGTGLDAFVQQRFYGPLAMVDTRFRPGDSCNGRCAATIASDRTLLWGMSQDQAARQLGGVSGHAGLFSTARDLSRFCRMLLGEGSLEGRRALSGRTVEQMTSPYFSRGGKVVRGLGWDMDSPYSSPRGTAFSEYSYGHTGYSGSSVWIDPASDLFVILLATRLDFQRSREFSRLRADISTAFARMYPLSVTFDEHSRQATLQPELP